MHIGAVLVHLTRIVVVICTDRRSANACLLHPTMNLELGRLYTAIILILLKRVLLLTDGLS